MKPTLEQVREYMDRDLETKLPPDPYEIALTLTAAILSSGAFADDRSGACDLGWRLVIPFYAGRLAYEQDVALRSRVAQHVTLSASDLDDAMSDGEARAYVTGGETGEIGEASAARSGATVMRVNGPPLTPPADPEAAAKQQRIFDLAQKVQQLQAAYLEADARGEKKKAAKLREEFDAACKEQSAAYE